MGLGLGGAKLSGSRKTPRYFPQVPDLVQRALPKERAYSLGAVSSQQHVMIESSPDVLPIVQRRVKTFLPDAPRVSDSFGDESAQVDSRV